MAKTAKETKELNAALDRRNNSIREYLENAKRNRHEILAPLLKEKSDHLRQAGALEDSAWRTSKEGERDAFRADAQEHRAKAAAVDLQLTAYEEADARYYAALKLEVLPGATEPELPDFRAIMAHALAQGPKKGGGHA